MLVPGCSISDSFVKQCRGVTDLQSNTDDIESIFNLWMLSPMSQLLTQPDTQTTQSHTPNKIKQIYSEQPANTYT